MIYNQTILRLPSFFLGLLLIPVMFSILCNTSIAGIDSIINRVQIKNKYKNLMLALKDNEFIALYLKVYLYNNLIFGIKSVLPESKSHI